jgi:hypothetical protein
MNFNSIMNRLISLCAPHFETITAARKATNQSQSILVQLSKDSVVRFSNAIIVSDKFYDQNRLHIEKNPLNFNRNMAKISVPSKVNKTDALGVVCSPHLSRVARFPEIDRSTHLAELVLAVLPPDEAYGTCLR